MATYLVDYDNLHDLSFVKGVSSGDRIVILFTGSAGIKLKQLEHYKNIGVDFECLEVTPGNNALDFQLDVFLGVLIGKHADDKFIIVSNDAGFKYAADMALKLGASVTLLTSRSSNPQSKKKERLIVQTDSTEKVNLQKEIKRIESKPATVSVFQRIMALLISVKSGSQTGTKLKEMGK